MVFFEKVKKPEIKIPPWLAEGVEKVSPQVPSKGPPLPTALNLEWPKTVQDIHGMMHRWIDEQARKAGLPRWQFEQKFDSLIRAKRQDLFWKLRAGKTLF